VWGYKSQHPTTTKLVDILQCRFNAVPTNVNCDLNTTDWANYTKNDKRLLALPERMEQWLDRCVEVQIAILYKHNLKKGEDWNRLRDEDKVLLRNAGLTDSLINYFDSLWFSKGWTPPRMKYSERLFFLEGETHEPFPEETMMIRKSCFFVDDLWNVEPTGCRDLQENYHTMLLWTQRYFIRRWTHYVDKKGLKFPQTQNLPRLYEVCIEQALKAGHPRLTHCDRAVLEAVSDDEVAKWPRAKFSEECIAKLDPYVFSLWRVMEDTPCGLRE